jgi:hypothetical protein
MKKYKLIKYELDVNCLTPCPYRLKGLGRIMVYSASCNECKHYKGKVKNQVKCSFEYDMQDEYDTDNVEEHGCIERVLPEEPKELPKIGEKWRVRQDLVVGNVYGGVYFYENMRRKIIVIASVHSENLYMECYGKYYSLEMLDGRIEEPSDCGSDCVCKEVEKSCETCKHNNDDECMYDGKCNLGTLDGWNSGESVKVEKVKKYKYVCKSCDSGKCVLIVKGSPSKFDCCPMGGDAKWKLKKEK